MQSLGKVRDDHNKVHQRFLTPFPLNFHLSDAISHLERAERLISSANADERNEMLLFITGFIFLNAFMEIQDTYSIYKQAAGLRVIITRLPCTMNAVMPCFEPEE